METPNQTDSSTPEADLESAEEQGEQSVESTPSDADAEALNVESADEAPEEASGEVPKRELSLQELRRAPWGDFYPVNEHKSPTDLEGNLMEFLDDLRQAQAIKETLVLAKIDQRIHQSYYKMWVRDTNAIFRMAVNSKRRLVDLKNREPK